MKTKEQTLDWQLKMFCVKWSIDSGWRDNKKIFFAEFCTEEVIGLAEFDGGELTIDYSVSKDEPKIRFFSYGDESTHPIHSLEDFNRLFAKFVEPDLAQWKKGVVYHFLMPLLDRCREAGISAEEICNDVQGYLGALETAGRTRQL